MVPFNVVICIILAQCLINLLGIWVLSKENNEKGDVIEKLSNKLRDKDAVIRIYRLLLKSKEEKDET